MNTNDKQPIEKEAEICLSTCHFCEQVKTVLYVSYQTDFQICADCLKEKLALLESTKDKPISLAGYITNLPLSLSPEISRRDFFAAFALAGFNANPNIDASYEQQAKASFRQADAMIEESEK